MRMNSISGVKYQVRDLEKTLAFYEALGFRAGNRTAESATCYVNWFWVTFELETSDMQAERGAGQSLYIKVENAGVFYQGAVALGIQPEHEPQKQPSGSTEFTLRDPDGYELVFFSKNSRATRA